jgi:hypothetical protein
MEWKASLTFMNRRPAEDVPLRSEEHLLGLSFSHLTHS